MTIHVLCLNPAIDKLYELESFIPGEDYPGQRPFVQIGGKGVNVARVLSQLDAQVRLYAFLGEMGAQDFRREMEPRCACSFIVVPGACRTTVNIIDKSSGKETVITESGPTVEGTHVQALLAQLEEHVLSGDIVCCSGSIIDGAPADIYARVAALCVRKQAKCALDCNVKALRPSLDGAHYALGKPNERELCALLNEERTQDPDEIVRLARRLGTYDALLVSMGAQGGVWVNRNEAYLARVPQVEAVSTVGSGDASFAGALYALANGMDALEALRLAMACGAANAMRRETGSIQIQDVETIREQIKIEITGGTQP